MKSRKVCLLERVIPFPGLCSKDVISSAHKNTGEGFILASREILESGKQAKRSITGKCTSMRLLKKDTYKALDIRNTTLTLKKVYLQERLGGSVG